MSRGGKREGAGRKTAAVPSIRKEYRIPPLYEKECVADIKAVLKKYRDLCKTQQ